MINVLEQTLLSHVTINSGVPKEIGKIFPISFGTPEFIVISIPEILAMSFPVSA